MNNFLSYLGTWLLFFVLVSYFMLPALLFQKIARRHNKKGWVFLLVGLFVGFLVVQIGTVVRLLLTPSLRSAGFSDYVPVIIMLVVNYALVILVVTWFRNYLTNQTNR